MTHEVSLHPDTIIENLKDFQNEVIAEIEEIAVNRDERRMLTSVVKNVIRKAKVRYKVVTIEEWMQLFLDVTDHQPIGQRLPVDPTGDKSQSIFPENLILQKIKSKDICIKTSSQNINLDILYSDLIE